MRWREENGSLDIIKLREDLKETDSRILAAIKERFCICKKIGEIKNAFKFPICDAKQEAKVIETRLEEGRNLALEDDLVRELMLLLMNYSKKIQLCVVNSLEIERRMK
jgi:chorismate mutase